MRKLFSLFFLIALPLFLFSQNIAVKSFRLLENDLDAQVNYPEIDRSNGEKAALIKIVTTETGFDFGGGQLGIVKAVYKTAEVWVYVPAKLKAITIAHPKLGQLPDKFYNFNIPIVSGKVYLMELVTGKVETTVKPVELQTQWLNIGSKPDGANVFIEDQLVGTTPFSRKYPEGTYTYRIEFPLYHSQAGKVELVGEKKVLDIALKPNFGSISITSAPESGMQIYLNDKNTGKTTPTTLTEIQSGDYTLKLMNQWFQPQSQRVTVSDGLTVLAKFTMSPAYADIVINTNPFADISIDGQRVGSGTYTSRMLAGVYTVKAEKEKHYPAQQQFTVAAGITQTIPLTLKPMTGSLDVASTPFDATITLDGKDYGTTSNTIKNLLVGDYTLVLKKQGYGTITKTVTIKENVTTEVNEKLPTGMEVTLTSTPTGAQLYIDGVLTGSTPFTTTLAFGNHTIKLVNGRKFLEENFTVVQNGKARFEFSVVDLAEQNDNLKNGMISKQGIVQKNQGIQGFRIRIYFESGAQARKESEDIAKLFMIKYPEIPVYRSYVSPYFNVSVGDFRSPESAQELCNKLIKDYLNAIIITEQINLPIENKAVDDLTDIDGNTYKTIKIGNQEWMAENLKTTRYQDGSPINNVIDNNAWTKQTKGAYCWYENNISNKSSYGGLYNFYAVVDNLGLCPTGWHIPTDEEWTTLTDYLGGLSAAGGKLKTPIQWNSPNSGANNVSGFSALPGGYRSFDYGKYYAIGSNGIWWSITKGIPAGAWTFRMLSSSERVIRISEYKGSGLSVRCVRDN